MAEVRAALWAGAPSSQPLQLPSLARLEAPFRTRNNQLLELALQPLLERVEMVKAKFGAHRIGVVVGTSTSGIREGELAVAHHVATGALGTDFHYAQQELGAPAEFLAMRLGATGPRGVVSTACSSSAKAMASAARWLQAGLVDAVVTGGADSACRFTVAGFQALESVSSTRCNPFSANRDGINIGEAAALFVMTREEGAVRLAGWGETSDAHHLSAPEPTGKGASEAMWQALRRAQLEPRDVEYVNAHGTATKQNDAMESRALEAVLGRDVLISSTKPLTGHTLGAAGALEAALCFLTLTGSGELPPHLWDGEADASLPMPRLVALGERRSKPPRVVLSNSFAFGGSNAVLAFVRA